MTVRSDSASHGGVEDVEVERQVDLVEVLAVEAGPDLEVGMVQLADDDPVARVGVHEAADLAIDAVQVGVAVVVEVQLVPPLTEVREPLGLGVRRVVAQLGILGHELGHVDPEAVDAAVEPEAQHVEHRGAGLGVRQFRSGCSRGTSGGSTGPWPRPTPRPDAAEHADPVVRRAAVGAGVAPDVPVALRVSRDERDSTNHGWRSLVWFGT
jgi:hypothetical protein